MLFDFYIHTVCNFFVITIVFISFFPEGVDTLPIKFSVRLPHCLLGYLGNESFRV